MDMKKYFYFYGSLTDQLWTFRIHTVIFQIKGPKYRPLFSERMGYLDFNLSLGRGWRFIFDRKKKP